MSVTTEGNWSWQVGLTFIYIILGQGDPSFIYSQVDSNHHDLYCCHTTFLYRLQPIATDREV